MALVGNDLYVANTDAVMRFHYEAGQTRKAVRILEQSKDYCRQHGIPFDGQDMLDELNEALASTPARNGKARRKETSA